MRLSFVFLSIFLMFSGGGCGDDTGSGGHGGSGGAGGTGGSGGSGVNPLLPAPPADQGVQFNIPAVTVPPGGEVQVCLKVKLPSTTDFYFDHIQMEMTPGGRH